MQRATSSLKLALIAVLVFAHCSCVSSVIEKSTNKHRGILSEGHSREQVRNEVGQPEDAWDKSSHKKPVYDAAGSHAYDVFKVRGVVARPGDGAAQATANAVTLGAGEAISLPFTVAGAAVKPFNIQRLVVFYDGHLMYRKHQIFNRKGGEIDPLGY